MPTRRDADTLRQVRALFDVGTMAGLADPQLLDRFAGRNREAAELAFAAMVERHGPMVLGVCRGVLSDLDGDAAHDAFQATFLVLVTRAGTLRRRESLGPWLHGVALRVARSARSAAIRRRGHERRKAEGAAVATMPPIHDDLPVVHEEFGRLPERYRAAMVLCDLEDRTHEQAARELGWPVGTVKSRLARGRAALRERLTRRGLAPGAASILAARPPVLPPNLLEPLTRIAARPAPGTVPAAATALLQGVQRAMLRQAILKATLAALTLAAIGATLAAQQPADPAVKRAKATAVEPPHRMITSTTAFLTMNGSDWLDTLGPRLRPIRTGTALRVWTAPVDVRAELQRRAISHPGSARVSHFEGAPATVSDVKKVAYVRSLKPILHKRTLSFQPEFAQLDDGSKLTMVGRSLDQGVLIRATVEHTTLGALRPLTVPDKERDRRLLKAANALIVDWQLEPSALTQVTVDDTPFMELDLRLINAMIQMPDLSSVKAEGEWLIPSDGILIIGLGREHVEPLPGAVEEFLSDLVPEYREWRSRQDYWSSPIREKLLVIDARSFLMPAEELRQGAAPAKP